MVFGDRRYFGPRYTCRQLKSIAFTVIMFLQGIIWVYVMLLAPPSESHENKEMLHMEIKQNLNDAVPLPGPPFTFKPLPDSNKIMDNEVLTNREDGVPKQVERPHNPRIDDSKKLPQVENQAEHAQNAQFDDLKQRQPLIKNKKKDNVAKNKNTVEANDHDYAKYFHTLLHHTILYRNASVIWKNPFVLNPTAICSRHSDLDLLVIVHTAPYNFRRRAMIRDQISNQRLNHPYTVQPVFMIGSVSDEKRNISKDGSLKSEYSIYGDLVKMDFVEDFRNLSLKAIMWLKWSNEFCKNANMILKIDDDVVLDIQNILPLSRGLFSKYKRSIFCHLNKIGSQPIPRIGRTEVDPLEFMRLSFYPYNYCSGFIVFLTPDLISDLEKSARKIPFYNVDDVFMFGMVPKFTGNVIYHNIGFNVSIWNDKVLKCRKDRGSMCPYFGTMAQKEEERLTIWNEMKRNHARDFHYPKLHIGPS